MAYLTRQEQQWIGQLILLPILIQMLEKDRQKVLQTKPLLRTFYSHWIDLLLRHIQEDLRKVKQICYKEKIQVTFRQKEADVLIYECRTKHYSYIEKYSVSALKWHLQSLLHRYFIVIEGERHVKN